MANRKPSQNYRRRSRKSDRLFSERPNDALLCKSAATDSDNLQGVDEGVVTRDQQPFFIVEVSPETVQREKEKARVLKKTRWWQRQMDRAICYYCQQLVSRDQMTLDHIVPLIRGGQSNRSNVVLACKSCNSRKKYLLPMEWEEFLSHDDSPVGDDRAPRAPVNVDEETGHE